jgi:hypothetical protein
LQSWYGTEFTGNPEMLLLPWNIGYEPLKHLGSLSLVNYLWVLKQLCVVDRMPNYFA